MFPSIIFDSFLYPTFSLKQVMALYLGSSKRHSDFLVKEWSRPNITPAECAGIWIKIMSIVFCNDHHPFQIKPYQERQTFSSPPQPLWVLSDDQAPLVVIEIRPLKATMDWGSINGHAYRYIARLNKHSRSTIGIIAHGDRFLCWEQTPLGDRRFHCTVPRVLFPARGSPASVVHDSEAVEAYFEKIKRRAKDGNFCDHADIVL